MEVLEWYDQAGNHIACPVCQTLPLRVVIRRGVRMGRCPNGHQTTQERLELWLEQLQKRKEARGG